MRLKTIRKLIAYTSSAHRQQESRDQAIIVISLIDRDHL